MTIYFEIIDGQTGRQRETDDALLISKLEAHGWLPFEDTEKPVHDPGTQYISTAYTVNETNVTPVYTVEDYPDMFVTGKWCKVEDGEIVAGPGLLGKDKWLMTENELNTIGWVRYVDDVPAYNADTQYTTSEKIISEDAVTETYAVHDYTAKEMTDRIVEAKTSKMLELYANIKQFITTQPNGFPRYDDDLKMNVMNAIITAIAAGDPEPAACTSVKNWISTMQTEFFTLKAAINGASDLKALRAVDVSIDTLEKKYGREGTKLVDPGISTDDLII